MVILERHDDVNAELDDLISLAQARLEAAVSVDVRRVGAERSRRRPRRRPGRLRGPPDAGPARRRAGRDRGVDRRRRCVRTADCWPPSTACRSARCCSSRHDEVLFLRRFGVVPTRRATAWRPRSSRAPSTPPVGHDAARRPGPRGAARHRRASGRGTGSRDRPAPAVRRAAPRPAHVVRRRRRRRRCAPSAARAGSVLRAGDLVVLTGELGAGKTTFTQGLGVGLRRARRRHLADVRHRARAPVAGRRPDLVHVDAYRLGGIDELDDLDLDTSLDDAVTVVEWGAGLVEALAEQRLEVTITRAAGRRGGRRTTPDPRRWSTPRRCRVLSSLATVLLAFDTATPLVTVALHDGEDVVAERRLDAAHEARRAARAADRRGAGRRRPRAPGPDRDRRRRRPGSVHRAAGRPRHRPHARATSSSIPVYGVCTLDVLAVEAVDTGAVAEDFLVATDARRKEVYLASYDDDGRRLDGPAGLEAGRRRHRASRWSGEGALLYPERFPHAGRARPARARAGWPGSSPRSGPSCSTPSRSTCAGPTRWPTPPQAACRARPAA